MWLILVGAAGNVGASVQAACTYWKPALQGLADPIVLLVAHITG